MEKLEAIGEEIRVYLDKKNSARDLALQHSRTLVRHCSKAIRAVHREEQGLALKHIQAARELGERLKNDLEGYPDLYHAGYTQDALKEYAEARIAYALIGGEPLPEPGELDIEFAAYLKGLGEVVGELRRRVLDLLRKGALGEAEHLLAMMDEIYGLLVTLDFPAAITNNLRRTTDMVRGVTERTRGDITTSVQQHQLKVSLGAVEKKLERS
jgi:translin